MIRILIADDHQVVRRGLLAFLGTETDMTVVGEAADGGEAVRLALALRPDVVLMDLVMAPVDGVAATRAIGRQLPGTRVVVLTSFAQEDRVVEAIRAGAVGYLLKSASGEEVTEAIRAAASGQASLAPAAAATLVRQVATADPLVGLSPREREVLALVAQGCDNAEVADRLHIAPATVKTHVSNLLVKLGARDRTGLVVRAMQLGLRP